MFLKHAMFLKNLHPMKHQQSSLYATWIWHGVATPMVGCEAEVLETPVSSMAVISGSGSSKPLLRSLRERLLRPPSGLLEVVASHLINLGALSFEQIVVSWMKETPSDDFQKLFPGPRRQSCKRRISL